MVNSDMDLEEDIDIPFNMDDPTSARKFIDGTLLIDAKDLNQLTREEFIKRYAVNKAQGIQNTALLFQRYDETLSKVSLMDKEIVSNSTKIKEAQEAITTLEKLLKKYESEKGEIKGEIALLEEELRNLPD